MKILCYYNPMLQYTNRTIFNINTFPEIPMEIDIISFNGGNGVNCSIIFNSYDGNIPKYIKINEGSFDGYCFYVIGYMFIRKNQYRLTLVRDVVSDYYEDLAEEENTLIMAGKEVDNTLDIAKNKFGLSLDVIKNEQILLSNYYDESEATYSCILFYSTTGEDGALNIVNKNFTSLRDGDIASLMNGTKLNISVPNTLTLPGFPGINTFAINYLRLKDLDCMMNLMSELMTEYTDIVDVHFVPFNIPSEDEDGSMCLNPLGVTNLVFRNTVPTSGRYGSIYQSRFSFNIDINNAVDLSNLHNGVKRESLLYRLSSPSFSGSYEYNPYSNNENLRDLKFRITSSIKPFGSCHILYPQYNSTGIYREWCNDSRGLICTDNTSVSKVDNAFVEFKRTNQMYQSTFDAKISSMEYSNSWTNAINQYKVDTSYDRGLSLSLEDAKNRLGIANTATLGVLGTAMGATDTFGKIEEYQKAVQMDADMAKGLGANAVTMEKLMFANQIANIKATPNSVSKVDGILTNNQMCFILEIFITSQSGISYIENYYFNNGYPINNFGKISDYIGNFIKAQVLKTVNLDIDQNLFTEMNDRLKGGMYNGRGI